MIYLKRLIPFFEYLEEVEQPPEVNFKEFYEVKDIETADTATKFSKWSFPLWIRWKIKRASRAMAKSFQQVNNVKADTVARGS